MCSVIIMSSGVAGVLDILQLEGALSLHVVAVGLRGCVIIIPVSGFITGDCGRVCTSSSHTSLT